VKKERKREREVKELIKDFWRSGSESRRYKKNKKKEE